MGRLLDVLEKHEGYKSQRDLENNSFLMEELNKIESLKEADKKESEVLEMLKLQKEKEEQMMIRRAHSKNMGRYNQMSPNRPCDRPSREVKPSREAKK